MVTYKHKKKVLHPFVALERNNSTLDWNSFDIKCNSNVPEDRGGFPEMDAYKWVSLDEAKMLLHETQVACLDKIKEIFNRES
jgi:predicted NUDIX family NTP pyrophosphohydrolase